MRTITWSAALVLFLYILAGCVRAPAASPTETPQPAATFLPGTLEEIPEIAGYEDWATLTDAPRDVSSYILGMCALPPPELQTFADSEHGQSREVWDYVNETGLATISIKGERIFPVGTVIVKEKFATGLADEPTALGIMIKHETGFNPDGGDWEYLYWEKEVGLMRDTDYDGHCQACHEKANTMDFVYAQGSQSE